MPADEYAPVVRGALKLKGSTPSGIKKKKKKPKISDTEASSSKKSALQSALEEEDAESSKAIAKKGKGEAAEEELDEEALRELEERGGDGKTASERAYEEMRRKRVCRILTATLWEFWRITSREDFIEYLLITFQLHDRLQKEGVKTHKQRVEELNKYLSNLSEHHDMYVPCLVLSALLL